MAQDTALGGQGQSGGVGFNPVSSTGVVSSQNTQNILSSVNDLIRVGASITAQRELDKQRFAEEQNREDVLLSKQVAMQDALQVETALQTQQSEVEEYNDIVAQGKEEGLTDTEISRMLYDTLLETRGREIGENVRDADKAYLLSISNSRTKSTLNYAQQDREKIKAQKANLIYSTSSVVNRNENLNSNFKGAVDVGKSYDIPEQQVANLYIQRAFDLAKGGDPSMLLRLDEVTDSQGIKIVDTIEGRALFSKLDNELLNKQQNDARQSEKDSFKARQLNTEGFFSRILQPNADLASIRGEIVTAQGGGDLSIPQYSSLTKMIDTLEEELPTFASVSTPEIYVDLRGKAERGYLNPEELVGSAQDLSEADFKAIANVALSKGGVDGTGSAEGRRVQDWINKSSRAIGQVDLITSSLAPIRNPSLLREKEAYASFQLDLLVNEYINENGAVPNLDALSKIYSRVKTEADAIYKLSTGNVRQVNKVPQSVREIDEYVKSLSVEEARAYINSLSPEKKRQLLRIQ